MLTYAASVPWQCRRLAIYFNGFDNILSKVLLCFLNFARTPCCLFSVPPECHKLANGIMNLNNNKGF